MLKSCDKPCDVKANVIKMSFFVKRRAKKVTSGFLIVAKNVILDQ
jgi:hypothetical protein